MDRFTKMPLLLFLLSFAQCEEDSVEADRCNLEPETGACLAAFTRYYYDKVEKRCKPFTWGGCNGVVPFETLEECESGCE